MIFGGEKKSDFDPSDKCFYMDVKKNDVYFSEGPPLPKPAIPEQRSHSVQAQSFVYFLDDLNVPYKYDPGLEKWQIIQI